MSDPNRPPDWNALAQSSDFKELARTKVRFLVPVCIFFIIYYFALLVLVGWFPDFMKQPVIGKVNGAYLFALSQFFMAWALAFIYVRVAAGWDKKADAVIKDHHLR